MVKHPNLKIPHYMDDKYKFALNNYPPKFPPLPITKMSLDFSLPFPRWFICGEDLKLLKK